MGHPDKVADRISDSILDAMLEQDPRSRVACETMVTTGLVVVAGEITSKAVVDVPQTVRQTIKDIGYTDPEMGFTKPVIRLTRVVLPDPLGPMTPNSSPS